MKKLKRFLHDNGIFIGLVAAAILTAVIFNLEEYIGSNPFAKELRIDAPVQAALAEDARYYVTDSSYTIYVTDADNTYRRKICGGNPENSFDHVSEICAYSDGEFYVLDKSLQEDGVTAQTERIIRFTDYGRHREVIYEQETASEAGVQVVKLSNPVLFNETLCFASIQENGISLMRCKNGSAEEWAFMPLENAIDRVNDCSFSQDGKIAVAMMNGEVHQWDGSSDTILMKSERSGDYCSLITEVQYDGDVLYLNDLGLRRILKEQDGQITEVMSPGTFADEPWEKLAQAPLFTGMNVNQGTVCVMVSSYTYQADRDEHSYVYQIGAVDQNGRQVFCSEQINPSIGWRVNVCTVYVALALAALLAAFAVYRAIRLVRQSGAGKNKTQVTILLVSLVVTFCVATAVFNACMDRYIRMSTSNLTNIGYLIEKTMDRTALQEFDTPEVYGTAAYDTVDRTIQQIFAREDAVSDSVYVVIYRVHGDVLYEAYRSRGANPVMYPLAGTFSNSVEEKIADSGDTYFVKDISLAEGSYSYIDVPIYDEDGSFDALVEVGEDYTAVTAQNNKLLRSIMIQTFMMVIIVMLLLAEVMNAGQAVIARHTAVRDRTPLPPELIRPITFMAFFTANITTAFLPIYSMSLWNDSFPLRMEIAAALPLSAELICGGVFSLICGKLLRGRSPKPLCCIGAVLYVGGNMLSVFAGDLWMLIGANSCCGIGTGLLLVSINTWITMQEDEKTQNRGFIHYNAAYLAGMNCGSVVGALIWEHIGIVPAYLAAAASAGILLVSVLFLMDSRRHEVPVSESLECKRTRLIELLTPRVIRYFICLIVPYLICASFLSYFFPIIAEKNALSAAEISIAFLVSGVISIYVGTTVGETIVERFGVRKSMILASFLYVVALFYLVYRPDIISCYVVIVLFAVGDSFGLAAQAVYYATLPEVNRYGESKAMAVNSTVESITSACGSVIFGAVLMLGYRIGVLVIAVIFLLLLIVFVIGDGRSERRKAVSSSQVG